MLQIWRALVTVQYKWEEKGLCRQFTNKISGEEVLKMNLKLQGDSRFDDIRYVINDFTEIVDFDFSDIDIQKISVMDQAASMSNPNIKIAIVSTLEPLLVWIKLYCESMKGSPYKCEIFDHIDNAHKWASE